MASWTGTDLPLFGLIREMPAHDVRMGLRVEAVWKDDDELGTSLENISGGGRRVSRRRST